MATKKVRNLVAKVGEYQDRNTGETKSRFMNVGVMMKNDDGSVFLLLDQTFNPAGAIARDGKVLINCWEDRGDNRSGQSSGGYSGNSGSGHDDRSGGQGSGYGGGFGAGGGKNALEDDIPFAHWGARG